MLNQIFNIINTIVIVIVCLSLSVQMIYTLFCIIRPKRYPKTKKQHKYAFVIAARNEEAVIGNLIDSIRNQNYPQELLDIFVVCHNCTDNTEGVLKEKGGVHIIVHNDDNPNHKRKGYALEKAFEELKNYDHEAYFIFDADNTLSPDFVNKMNDAFDSGAKICQGFRNAKNFDQNAISVTNSFFHLRDCSFNNHARTILGSSSIIFGTGFLFSREVLTDLNWDCFSLTEDAEFTIKTVLKGCTTKTVNTGIFYDEQPTSFMVTMHRQARMGRGTFFLFFQNVGKLFKAFFKHPRYVYLDMIINLMYAPSLLLACVWFPFYYSYLPIVMLINNQIAEFQAYLIMIAKMVALCIILPVTVQNIIALLLNIKRIKIKKWYNVFLGIILFPFINLGIAVAVICGVLNPNLKWKEVKHSCILEEDKMNN